MDDKKKLPFESDQQWLKELLESTDEEFPEKSDIPIPDLQSDDDQWLNELFASAEEAAEQEFAPKEPEEEELPPLVDFSDPEWPDSIPETPLPAEEIGPDEQAVAAAGLIHPEDVELERILQEAAAQRKKEEALADGLQPETDQEGAEEDPAEKFVDQEEDLPQEPLSTAPQKRRPKNKNSYGMFGIPHILVTGVWLAIILTFGVFLGQWIWQGASDVLAFGREEKIVTIYISEKDDLDSLTEKLYDAGLIKEPTWFRLYGQLTDVMKDIGFGTFTLNTLYDYHALVAHMSPYSSARVTVKVVIPEGYNCAQIFALLEEKNVCSASALEEAAMTGQLTSYWFLEGVERNHKYCLEGYLFPDTYTFYEGDNPNRVLSIFLDNFNVRFTDIMLEHLDVINTILAEKMRANGLSEEYIAQHAITIREVVIIASMIEEEAANTSEGYTISSVIYNRLANPVEYPYLNIDAALVYATGNPTLTEEHKTFDSPYNTYLYPGLIPGPISNPSRASLYAALDPANTNYYFYAYNPETYVHHFSETYAEHQAFLDSLPKEEEEVVTP